MGRSIFQPDRVDDEPLHTLGQVFRDHDGQEYRYIQAGGAIDENDVVIIKRDHKAAASTAAALRGERAAVAKQAIAANKYAWVCQDGEGNVNAISNTPANTQLRVSATAGHVDDSGGGDQLSDFVLTSARGGGNGTSAAMWSRPVVQGA